MLRTASIRRTNESLVVTHEVYGKLRHTLGETDFADWVDHLNEVAQAGIASEFVSAVKRSSKLESARCYEPARAEQTLVHDGTTVIIRVELTGTNRQSFGDRHELVNQILGGMVAHAALHLDSESDNRDSDGAKADAALALLSLATLLRGATQTGDGLDDPFAEPAFGTYRNGDGAYTPPWGTGFLG